MMILALSVMGQAEAGTITGQVNFSGTPPEPKTINMNADPSCAALHSGAVVNPNMAVNAEGKLKNVFVYIKEGLEGQAFDVPNTPVILDQKGCMYFPRVFGLQVGQKLEILNSDSTLHNVHGMPEKSKEFNLGMPIQGMKLKREFGDSEIMVKFKCDVHPWMTAYAGVLTHPFFAVTAEDGSFEIKDVPAGTYTIEVWHEALGAETQTVEVNDTANVNFELTL